MSFQSAAVAVSVAQEIGFMVWDSAMEKAETADAIKAKQRATIEELAETLIEWRDFNGDWKDAACAMQDAVIRAAGILEVEIIIWTDAYDCPRRWSWEVA